jgi:hypothetical protein
MFVYKRDGRREEVHFDKITARIKKLCYELDQLVDPVRLRAPLLAEDIYNIVQEHKERLNSAIIYDRDFKYVPIRIEATIISGSRHSSVRIS